MWHFGVIGEPIATLGGAVLTFISYLVVRRKNENNLEDDKQPAKISQKHSGTGDNVGGDKIINN